MSIRMKTVERCSSSSHNRYCSYTEEPIDDWIIYPQNPPTYNWSKGNAYPRDLVRQIQVPELQYVYPGYDSFKFKVSVTDSAPSGWLSLQNDKLIGSELHLGPGESTNFIYRFINLELLPAGEYVNQINIIAFGIKNGVETELTGENIYSSGTIKISVSGTGSGGGGTNPPIDSKIRPHKNGYTLSVTISSTGDWDIIALFGDTEIIVLGNDNNENLYIEDINTPGGNVPLLVNPRNVGANGNKGEFVYSNMRYPVGVHKLFFNILNDNKQVLYTFPVFLTLTDQTSFEVSPGFINQSIDKLSASVTTIKAELSNPNNFNISVQSKPDFVQSVNITGNDIAIIVKPGSDLTLGTHFGDIVFTSGSVTRKISMTITVVNFITSDFTGELYYFALDKKKISMSQSNSLATKAYMKLEMFFSAMEKSFSDVQEFQMSYFKGQAEFDPGKEIQDFFIKIWQKLPVGDFIAYGLAQVKISFTERKDDNTVINSYDLPKLFFAAGKKPKCYPLFTDYPIRRTFDNSKILISSDILSQKKLLQDLIYIYSEPKPDDTLTASVKTYLFERYKFAGSLKNKIISNEVLSLIPFPEPNSTAHIFWINQNLVFDWFTASGYNSVLSEFEHAISDNYKDGRDEKYGSIQNDTLKINTGWIIAEERELIDDLLKSPFCIVEVGDKVLKCLPNNKKNEIKNSSENLFSMILEFKILRDER